MSKKKRISLGQYFAQLKRDRNFVRERVPELGPIGVWWSPSYRVLRSIRKVSFAQQSKLTRAFVPFLTWRQFKKLHCMVAPTAIVGERVFFPNPFGVIIGTGAVVEDNVTIEQEATLGNAVRRGEDRVYPVVKEGANVMAGARILGAIDIGEGATVRPNAVVLSNVPAGDVADGFYTANRKTPAASAETELDETTATDPIVLNNASQSQMRRYGLKSYLADVKSDLNFCCKGKWKKAPIVWLWRPNFRLLLSIRTVRLAFMNPILRPLLPWLQWRQITQFGSSCSPTAIVGRRVALPHAVGVGIGAGVVIEDDVTILQLVTLGNVMAQDGGVRQYPVLRKGSSVYAGAKIVGGIEIGEGARVGANALVVKDVPAGATAVGNPARVITK